MTREYVRPTGIKLWWYRHRGVVFFLGFFGTLLSLLSWGLIDSEHNKKVVKQTFMEDCLTERKQYECTAMWRAGEGWFKD